MEILSFVKKPFYVEAVQVTTENMLDVAKWCGGTIESVKPAHTQEMQDYILAPVLRPQNDRQRMAFVGDWLVKAGEGFKVYTDRALMKGFDISPEPPCGLTDNTADNQPCVLGRGHRNGPQMHSACRSLQDYLTLHDQRMQFWKDGDFNATMGHFNPPAVGGDRHGLRLPSGE